MSELVLPFERSAIEHRHVQVGLPPFLGYDSYPDGSTGSKSHVITYRHGNVIALKGAVGPWFARQVMGPFSGTIYTFWTDGAPKRDAELISEHLGYGVTHSKREVHTKLLNDDNVIGKLFAEEPAGPTAPSFEVRYARV